MSEPSRPLWIAVVVVWAGAYAGFGFGPAALLGAVVVAAGCGTLGGRHGWLWGLVLVLGVASGVLSHQSDAATVRGLGGDSAVVTMSVRTVTDPLRTRFGWRQVIRPDGVVVDSRYQPWAGPPIALQTDEAAASLGERMLVTGRLRPDPGSVGRRVVAGTITDPVIELIPGDTGAVRGLAEWLRARVLARLDSTDRGEALLAGFLVGDTSGVADTDLDALRRAGLTHFVAVSGSNVALFLGLWWLVLAPFARHPALRAISGLFGVVVFVLLTRAEPSVIRAGAMVSVLLMGRLLGWAFDRWTALALGVLGCLAISGRLAADVGFGLSVAATSGVMWGAGRLRFQPQAVATLLGASLSAQVAVAPILLLVFGSMPLLSPLANLVAAPLVSAATAVGGIGVLVGAGPMVQLGAAIADLVLFVADVASPWPQVGPLGAGLLSICGLGCWYLPALRPVAGLLAAVAVAAVVVPAGVRIERPAVVFLDVGQGDSALILGEGFTVLIDGGPDPVVLDRKLDRYGVDRIDLIIASHVHADHLEGLRAVLGRIPVGALWASFEGQSTPASGWLSTAAPGHGLTMTAPPPGTVVERGGVRLEVVGPLRRYASPNDQSIVVQATIGDTRVLFPGDIEVIAQNELRLLTTDILKVPHQGAATSDPDWLAGVGADLAVISVGPNEFGHPAPWVIDTLVASGALVKRTDADGDVAVGPGGLTHVHPWWMIWR